MANPGGKDSPAPTMAQPSETFFVTLTSPVNAALAGTGGVTTSLTSTPKDSVTRGQATIN